MKHRQKALPSHLTCPIYQHIHAKVATRLILMGSSILSSQASTKKKEEVEGRYRIGGKYSKQQQYSNQ